MKKSLSLLMIGIVYLIIILLGNWLWDYLKTFALFEKLLITLLSISIILYIVNLGLKVRILDPFYSVAPILVIIKSSFELKPVLIGLISLIILSSLWLISSLLPWFKSCTTETWLSVYYKQKVKGWWLIFNLLFFYVLPTLLLYLILLSPLMFLAKVNDNNLNLSTLIGFLLGLIGLVIILLSHFQQLKTTNLSKNGLWSKSRYPNIFGKILVVIASYLMTLSLDESQWILFVGPLLYLIMYQWLIIPLSEKKRLLEVVDYFEYIKSTNLLIPLSKRNL